MTTSTLSDPAPRTIDDSQTPRASFLQVVSLGLRKAVDTRAGRWLVISIIALTVIAMAVFYAVADADERTYEGFVGFATAPQGFLLPVLGILLITSEWSQRTAMVTFALEPSRMRVIWAKLGAALVLGLIAFVAGVLVALAGSAVGGAADPYEGLELSVLALFLAVQLVSLVQGVAYGLILLNTPAAVVAYFVLPTASSIIFGSIPALDDVAPWLDLGSAQSVLFSSDVHLTGEDYAHLGTTAVVWILIPLVIGLFRVRRAELK